MYILPLSFPYEDSYRVLVAHSLVQRATDPARHDHLIYQMASWFTHGYNEISHVPWRPTHAYANGLRPQTVPYTTRITSRGLGPPQPPL